MSVSIPTPVAAPLSRQRRDDAWRDVPRAVLMRAGALAIVTWVPMLLLSIAETLTHGHLAPLRAFLGDFTIHVRFLMGVPALVIGDTLCEAAIYRCERHLLSSGMVPPTEERLRAWVSMSRKLRGSTAAALVLAGIVVAFTIVTRGNERGEWLDLSHREGHAYASVWLGFVAFPVFRFLLLRWFFRWFVWSGFLGGLTKFDLNLVATHPDRCGGLGFLTVPVSATLGVVLSVSVTVAMSWRYAILDGAVTIGHIRGQAGLLGAIWIVVLLGPLVTFAPRLLRLKRIALIEYAKLGEDYSRAFQDKWVRAPAPREELLGTSDIQSLADLKNSMDVIGTLRPTPIDMHVILPIALVYVVALLPVVLSQLSIEQLLASLVKVVL